MSGQKAAGVFRARWVVPVVQEPVEDGAVVCRGGRILAVGSWKHVRSDWGGAPVEDLGDSILFPGLVNAHTHLDNSAMAGSTPRGGADFVSWIEAFLQAKDRIGKDARRESTLAAGETLPALGTIALADICPTGYSAETLGAQPLLARVFIEVTGLGRDRAQTKLAEAVELLHATRRQCDRFGGRIQVSLSPHASYSTDPALISEICRLNAGERNLTSFHLAESKDEVQFLTGEDDKFAGAITRWGLWDEELGGRWPPGLTPVRFLAGLGVLRPGLLAEHCVQLDDEEIRILARSGCAVCICPRSNDYIGVGLPRTADMLAAGIEPCLGTDGLASVGSLSLFDEMAFVSKRYPGIGPQTVLRMATLYGARALGLQQDVGSLEPGRIARFLFIEAERCDDPLGFLTSGVDHSKLSWIGDGRGWAGTAGKTA